MCALLLVGLALGHGGEEHGAPPVVVAADSTRVSASSADLDAVLRVPDGPPGVARDVSLLLADHRTSAPIDGATATLTLSGPGSVRATLGSAGAPGVYHGDTTFPGDGTYAGSMIVQLPPDAGEASDLSDGSAGPVGGGAEADGGGVAGGPRPPAPGATRLLAVSGLVVGATPESAAVAAGGLPVVTIAAGFGLVGLVGVVFGFLLGRRAGTAASLLLAGVLGLATREVEAHGGEDHGGGGAAPPPTGAGLNLLLERQFLVGLRTHVTTRDRFQERVPGHGRFVARPGQAASVGAPVDGTLLAPPGGFPTPGQAVRAGDVLALVREVPIGADRAMLAQERGDAATRVAEARRALALAERDMAGIEALGNALSERERLERRSAVEVAEVALREAERALASLAEGVTVPVRAPVAGRLGAVAARPGDQVAAGELLFRVSDPTGLWMEAAVSERLALGLLPGAPATVSAAAAPGRFLSATVLDAGQEADPATGSVTVTLAVDDAGLGLLPGMGATAWIGRGAARDALVAPAAAILDADGIALAFVKTGPESFEARELRIGARAGPEVEVLAGLAPGDRIVTEGVYALRSLAGR
jgi:cobalt-zinc-cadmium efflux system membrane fusion protein